MSNAPIHRPLWAEVSVSRVHHNLGKIRALVGARDMFAVMKADAYGHGATTLAPLVQSLVDGIAVASVEEALELRAAGYAGRLLVLGYTPSADVASVLAAGLELTVLHLKEAISFSRQAVELGGRVKIHVKIDTGMARLGLPWRSGAGLAREIMQLPGVNPTGVFSHLAVSDEAANPFNQVQLKRFLKFCREEGLAGIPRHLANSGGVLNLPDAWLEGVRPGILCYGLSPDGTGPAPEGFLPAMRLCTRVVDLRTLRKGESVSYGQTWTAPGKRRLATLAAGYADGIPRALSGKGEVLIGRERAPMVGRICMDFLMVDVTGIQGGVSVGQEVTLFGEQEGASLSAGEVASRSGTIHYELVSLIGKRVPRVYTET